MRRLSAVLATLCFALAGCASIVGIDDDIAVRGAECQGDPLPTLSGVLQIEAQIVDITAMGAPLSGIQMAACEAFDPGCASAAIAVSDLSGNASVAIPLTGTNAQGFAGRLRFTGTGTRNGESVTITPTTWLFSNRLRPDPGTPERVSLVVEVGPDAGFTGLLSTLGVERTPGRGLVTFEVRDCAGMPLSGARVDLTLPDEDADIYYVNPPLPFDATPMQTEVSGRGGIFTLPVGTYSLTVDVPALSRLDAVQFSVADDELTFLRLDPL
jgi:predicted small secreted protein